ncbi:MAG: SMP-30/gluconolactonase/LRE family protein [Deltaproteobacteria bacterium]|nr:SMP-30/gluconolactonase/LRE family protein [Deltaproteobacteria bacterium]
MKKYFIITMAILGILIVSLSTGYAKSVQVKSVVPLPPALKNVPTIKVEPWLQVEPGGAFLEGPAFDRQGNLFVSSIFDSRILKITPDKKVTTILKQDGLLPDGIAIHKDGRLFLACLSGKIVSVNPDGSDLKYIEAKYEGFPKSANDLVFDSKGNFYITDFIGTAANPVGGVYRYSSDFREVKPVFRNLATANGVALSPQGNVLWVTETGRNALHYLQLLEDGITINPVAGALMPYRFTGSPGGCDSNAVDADGNVYQAIIFQGRILVLNNGGIPVAQVLIPGRDAGKLLRTTNVACKPGTDEVYVTLSGDGGAWIYKFQGLATGLKLYSHQ